MTPIRKSDFIFLIKPSPTSLVHLISFLKSAELTEPEPSNTKTIRVTVRSHPVQITFNNSTKILSSYVLTKKLTDFKVNFSLTVCTNDFIGGFDPIRLWRLYENNPREWNYSTWALVPSRERRNLFLGMKRKNGWVKLFHKLTQLFGKLSTSFMSWNHWVCGKLITLASFCCHDLNGSKIVYKFTKIVKSDFRMN